MYKLLIKKTVSLTAQWVVFYNNKGSKGVINTSDVNY